MVIFTMRAYMLHFATALCRKRPIPKQKLKNNFLPSSASNENAGSGRRATGKFSSAGM